LSSAYAAGATDNTTGTTAPSTAADTIGISFFVVLLFRLLERSQ
jgi:hypothetical protein